MELDNLYNGIKKLGLEAKMSPVKEGLIKRIYESTPSAVKTALAVKKMLGLIRRDSMRVIRNHWMYNRVFGHVKQYIVKLAYGSVCVIAWVGLYTKGGLLLFVYVILGCITIHYVSAHMKNTEQDLVYMNILMFYLNSSCVLVFLYDYVCNLLVIGLTSKFLSMLVCMIMLSSLTIIQMPSYMQTLNEEGLHMNIIMFYVNIACIVSFFFGLYTKGHMEIYVPEYVIMGRNASILGVNAIVFMCVRKDQEAKLISLQHPVMQKYTRRCVAIIQKELWFVHILTNDFLFDLVDVGTKITLFMLVYYMLFLISFNYVPSELIGFVVINSTLWISCVVIVCVQGYCGINLVGKKTRKFRIKYGERK